MRCSNNNGTKKITTMKKLQNILSALLVLLLVGACEQELVVTTPPEHDLTNVEDDPCDGNAGSANFAKFVSIGNSFVAGVQGGALFTEGQNNSMPSLINKQLACAGGTETFVQQDIKASLGWNLFVTQPILT